MDRTDRIYRDIRIVLGEIKRGKIKNVEDLDKRLSSVNLIRIPLLEDEVETQPEIKEVRDKLEGLEGRKTDYYIDIGGSFIALFGAILSLGNFMSWLFLLSSIAMIIFVSRIIIRVHREITANRLLLRYWHPYILIEGNLKLRKQLIGEGMKP